MKEQRVVHIPSPRVIGTPCDFGHDVQFIREWYEELAPGSSCAYLTHKIMLVCKKCAEVIIKTID